MGVPQDRKTRIILNNLEIVRADIERTIENTDDREQWREAVRGSLMYHLGCLYDEGAGYTKDLETSVAILRDQVKHLKAQLEEKKAAP